MKFWNRHLLLFILAVIAWTLIFRLALSHGIANENALIVWGSAIAYFFALFFTGRYIASSYYEEYLGQDYGLIWHTATYIFAILTGAIWIQFGFPAAYESMSDIYTMAAGWGAGLFIHFLIFVLSKPKTIKGLSNDDIFE